MQERKQVKFVMTTLIGGVIFLVPLVFLVMVGIKAISLMMLIAKPLANWLPVDTIAGVALADELIGKLETRLLEKLPGYAMVRNVLKGFDDGKQDGVKPVILKLGSAERAGFEVQRLEDGRSVVFIPGGPNAFSGMTQVLPPEQVTYLDVPLNRIIECSQNYGHGLAGLVQAKSQQANA